MSHQQEPASGSATARKLGVEEGIRALSADVARLNQELAERDNALLAADELEERVAAHLDAERDLERAQQVVDRAAAARALALDQYAIIRTRRARTSREESERNEG